MRRVADRTRKPICDQLQCGHLGVCEECPEPLCVDDAEIDVQSWLRAQCYQLQCGHRAELDG
eukprot:3997245-Karenia_brevis.AAC.1